MKREEPAPANHGATWTEEHLRALQIEFEQGASIETLAHHHQRTQGAIAGKLVALGLLINRWGEYHKIEKAVYYGSKWG